MDRNSLFYRQARLMMQIMPFVEKEPCFALKGGTAINFFLRNMPRLSVDIDLAYLPIEGRDETLDKISEALIRIADSIKKVHRNFKIQAGKGVGSRARKLFINDGVVQIKIEPNEIIRGSVFKIERRSVSEAVEDEFELSASLQVLSAADIYGGKLCAALDRQHPRDLFDVKQLLENEGITNEIRKSFVVYLAGHDRPMHELLNPTRKDMSSVFDREFSGMTTQTVSYEELEKTREEFIGIIQKELMPEECQFLISIKEQTPDWSLLKIEGLDKLPSIQWKLLNLSKMDAGKHSRYLKNLKDVLGKSELD